MRHRMATGTGLGNPDPEILNNKGIINKDFGDHAIKLWFSKWGGFDFRIRPDVVAIGIEPTYQGDSLKIIQICRNKAASSIATGYAFGLYGSGIRSRTRVYGNYKRRSPFIQFVDKWHPVLFPKEKS